jgi:DMSO reductase anchor subunit
MSSAAEVKGVIVDGLIVAAVASMLWLPRMRTITQRAVTAGTITPEHGRETLARVSAVPFVIALGILFALLALDVDVPAAVRVVGFAVALVAVAVSFAMRNLVRRA